MDREEPLEFEPSSEAVIRPSEIELGAVGAMALGSTVESNHTEPHSPESDGVNPEVESEPVWLRRHHLARQRGLTLSVTKRATDVLREEMPQHFRQQTDSRDGVVVECSSDVMPFMPAPEGWANVESMTHELETGPRSVQRLLSKIRDEYEEVDFMTAKGIDDIGQSEHFSPPIADNIREVIGERQKRRRQQEHQKRTTKEFEDFADEMMAGESLEAQAFERVIKVYGAESGMDVLTQYHPKFKSKHLMPLVKSFLADYLGEFMVSKGELDWDDVNYALPSLSNKNLRLQLTEVIKHHCLKTYHTAVRNDPDQDDFEIIAEYLDDIRNRFEDVDNENINEVIEAVDEYYLSLFEIEIPEKFVDNLAPGRPFPDLNQRINIKEIIDKKRMLIGDDPGMGKSASAIMAKEVSGAKCAVVFSPSQVLDEKVWQTYLSDEEGGYFKKGEAPRVLEVKGASDLRGVKAEDYDYILVSESRISPEITEALKLIDYDMAIVDEAHRYKNIRDGKRSERLIELTETLNGPDDHVVLLTATPAPNTVADIAMTLRLLYPNRFENYSNADLIHKIIGGDLLDIRSLLIPRMQMKRLADSMEMPPHHEYIHKLTLDDHAEEVYGVLLDNWEMDANEKLQFLRQILMNQAKLDATPDVVGVKEVAVGEKLNEVFQTKDKVLMFVNDYITDIIRGSKSIIPGFDLPDDVDVRVIYGDTKDPSIPKVSKRARRQIQHDFQNNDGKMLLVVSGQTISVGVDLSAADEVFFYNEPWTETERRQQLGRALRPGRKGELVSRTFIVENTIEEGMHAYIQMKNRAIEKLLYGVPLNDIEMELIKTAERDDDEEAFAINPELGNYYFSSTDRMNRVFFRQTKEIGEDKMERFVAKDGKEYAETYRDLMYRSYGANASRLSSTIVSRLISEQEDKFTDEKPVILDMGSGPQMLKRHIADQLTDSVISLDINPSHFESDASDCVVAKMSDTTLEDESVDIANMSLAYHYTRWVPARGETDRLKTLHELNRVLKPGGQAVITFNYRMDLMYPDAFMDTLNKLGFEIVQEYSGPVQTDENFRGRVLTLKKVAKIEHTVDELVEDMDDRFKDSLRLSGKNKVGLRDTRMMATHYTIQGQGDIPTIFNSTDQQVHDEETGLLNEMKSLREKYGRIEEVPPLEIVRRGFSRIFNGRGYVLFKRLVAGEGAVVFRN